MDVLADFAGWGLSVIDSSPAAVRRIGVRGAQLGLLCCRSYSQPSLRHESLI